MKFTNKNYIESHIYVRRTHQIENYIKNNQQSHNSASKLNYLLQHNHLSRIPKWHSLQIKHESLISDKSGLIIMITFKQLKLFLLERFRRVIQKTKPRRQASKKKWKNPVYIILGKRSVKIAKQKYWYRTHIHVSITLSMRRFWS